jgi:murein DD-endopeptidase MepM/ murein hydrolase activator NlpD
MYLHAKSAIVEEAQIARQEGIKAYRNQYIDNLPQEMHVCYLGARRNMPKTDKNLKVKSYTPVKQITRNVSLAVAPVEKGCLYSGFGPRRGRLHKGVDIAYPKANKIYAAGAGTIIERSYHRQYGHMLVLAHGDNVYTRYAHLESFSDLALVGNTLRIGQEIGVMGRSADKPVGRHLHYEILYGNINTPMKSYGLKPVNVMRMGSIAKRPKTVKINYSVTVKPNDRVIQN